MAAATPMTRFLATTELLEQMFLQSDQQTLLTSIQRVCCRWHDIVSTSPALQVHLFRKPAPAREGLEPVLNPLLVAKFPFFFTRVQQAGSPDGGSSGSSGSCFAPSRVGDDSRRGTDDDSGDDVFYSQAQFHRLPLAANPEPYMRHGASWRTMHVRQPPLEGLGVALPMVRYSQRHLQDVKMGMLYDYVLGQVLPSDGSTSSSREEWRMVWGRIDGLDPAMELWSDYYEGIRRQLATEVDAVLILRSNGGGTRRGGGSLTTVAAATEDDDDGGDEHEDTGGTSLSRLVHPDSVMSGPV